MHPQAQKFLNQKRIFPQRNQTNVMQTFKLFLAIREGFSAPAAEQSCVFAKYVMTGSAALTFSALFSCPVYG